MQSNLVTYEKGEVLASEIILSQEEGKSTQSRGKWKKRARDKVMTSLFVNFTLPKKRREFD